MTFALALELSFGTQSFLIDSFGRGGVAFTLEIGTSDHEYVMRRIFHESHISSVKRPGVGERRGSAILSRAVRP
jgi:hypothetical protein